MDARAQHRLLFDAVRVNDRETAEIILNSEKFILTGHEAIGSFTLSLAASKNDILMVKLLLERIDIESRDNAGDTVFYRTCQCAMGNKDVDRREMLVFLLKRGADINTRNDAGRTPLHAVCRSYRALDNLWLIKFLFDNGADIDIEDVNGVSARHHAYPEMQEYADRLKFTKKAMCFKFIKKNDDPYLHDWNMVQNDLFGFIFPRVK